jgi:hypothetical protein
MLDTPREDDMAHPFEHLQPDDIVLDAVPEDVLASMENRDRWMAGLQYPEGGLEFMVADLQSWTPGQTVRVAFLGGSAELHTKIEEAAQAIMAALNLTLDFRGEDGYRTWTTEDVDYAAEIRVSFDQGGYFSLVGTDSVNPNIGLPQGTVGGRANQRSLNLGGFDVALPAGWDRTTRHEFLHALAFHHEHQNMRGPCEAAFRWEDDPGYQPTRDPRGAFVPDSNGRRPGIYTYLSGYPNGWSKAKVDHNLRTNNDNPRVTSGPFDPASVMLYRFPALFYRTQPSPCSPSGGRTEPLRRRHPRTQAPVPGAGGGARGDRHASGGAPEHDRGRHGRRAQIGRRSSVGPRLGRGRAPAGEPGATPPPGHLTPPSLHRASTSVPAAFVPPPAVPPVHREP